MRPTNSWTLRLHEVSTPEVAEVFAINSLAPFVINGKLRTFMEGTGPVDGSDGVCPKFIVNVSAMEGRFYRYKSTAHPHTNMAKV